VVVVVTVEEVDFVSVNVCVIDVEVDDFVVDVNDVVVAVVDVQVIPAFTGQ